MPTNVPKTCDLFCKVIDNYGDIGVSWRLARQLQHEYHLTVRLWVDDLASFVRLHPTAHHALAEQYCEDVLVCHWTADFPQTIPAELVLAMFSCPLPENYIQAIAQQAEKTIWLNLEYLSAEDWVEQYHALPSPHTSLRIKRYFFFPGFTQKTGGLLRERHLFVERDSWSANNTQQAQYWESLGLAPKRKTEIWISLFSYENSALQGLLQTWSAEQHKIVCLVPEGRITSSIAEFFQVNHCAAGDVFELGNVRVHILPFVAQEQYDYLLWSCDINFVRGEDSLVRALWAGKPFIWHVYPQEDGVHLQKLEAFLKRYQAGLSTPAAQVFWHMLLAWNQMQESGSVWQEFLKHRVELSAHVHAWAARHSDHHLAENLLKFAQHKLAGGH